MIELRSGSESDDVSTQGISCERRAVEARWAWFPLMYQAVAIRATLPIAQNAKKKKAQAGPSEGSPSACVGEFCVEEFVDDCVIE